MPDSVRRQLQHAVLSGLITSDHSAAERFALAERMLTPDHFAGDEFRFWQVLTRYHTLTGAVPSKAEFDELLAGAATLSLEARASMSALFEELESEEIGQARFLFSLYRLRERVQDEEFAAALARTSEIHLSGSTVEGKSVSGFADALAFLNSKLAKIVDLQNDAPEGDINEESAAIQTAYRDAKAGISTGILTGFRELDELTNGIQPGELWLIAAYTAEGKSKTAFNIAYHAAYHQGKNVLLGSAEQTREQVRRNIVCLHSRHPKFGYPRGLRYHDVRMGRLDPDGESVLAAVLEDMRTGQYGKMYIFAVPHRSSVDYLSAKVRQESRKFDVDLLVVDYLGLMTSAHRRQQRREELDDMLIQAKRLATDANGGEGVPVLSPWQVSRAAWERAVETGKYTRASLSDTSQAEKSSDLIMSLLRQPDDHHRLLSQILKYRDGDGDLTFHLNTDFASSYVGSDDTLQGLLE